MGIWRDIAELAYVVIVVAIVIGELVYIGPFAGVTGTLLTVAISIFILAIIGYYIFEKD